MDGNELFRLMTLIRKHIGTGNMQVGRTKDQIADIQDRYVQSVWQVLTDLPIETVELRADDKEAVVGCTTVELGERTTLPDNRIGPCQWGCGRIVQWRPYLPDHVTKACLYCVVDRLEQGVDL
jgi:hypothetical protein